MGKSTQQHAWNEVYALILLGIGTLLFLALISYVPKEIPTWFAPLNVTPLRYPGQNFLGPVGVITAGVCYFLMGAASYLLASVLLGFGGAKLFPPGITDRATDRLDRAFSDLRAPAFSVCSIGSFETGRSFSTSRDLVDGSATHLAGAFSGLRWARGRS